jgi:hypothetical protein
MTLIDARLQPALGQMFAVGVFEKGGREDGRLPFTAVARL